MIKIKRVAYVNGADLLKQCDRIPVMKERVSCNEFYVAHGTLLMAFWLDSFVVIFFYMNA